MSHEICSASSATRVDCSCSSMDCHPKLVTPDEIVVVQRSGLSGYLADSALSGYLEAQIHWDSGVIFCFGKDITLLLHLSQQMSPVQLY